MVNRSSAQISKGMIGYSQWYNALYRARVDAQRAVEDINHDIGKLDAIVDKAKNMRLPHAVMHINDAIQQSKFRDTTLAYATKYLPKPTGEEIRRTYDNLGDAVRDYVAARPQQQEFAPAEIASELGVNGTAPVYQVLKYTTDLKETKVEGKKVFVRVKPKKKK